MTSMRSGSRAVLFVLFAAVVASETVEARDWMAIAGGRILKGDGTLESGRVIMIKDGVIEGITTPDDVPDSVPVTTVDDDAVITPGLVALNSEIGCRQQNIELAKVIDPAPNCKDAIDPLSVDLRRALEAGFTVAMVAPAPTNIVSGVAVTFRTVPGEALDLLTESPLIFSLGQQVLRASAEPTSRSKATYLLAECLREARAGEGPQRIRDFLAGRLPGLLFCSAEQDIRGAMREFGETGQIPDLVYTPANRDQRQTERLAQGLAAARVRVVMGPFDWNTPEPTLRAAGIFAKRGVPVAFASGLPDGDVSSARRSASLAVRFGMSPAAARRGLTAVAAAVAGVGDRLGLERGRDADLVIFTGDPLRPDSRVTSVYVRGERVVAAESGSEADK